MSFSSKLRRKPYLLIPTVGWLLTLLVMVFFFEEVSDNRFFVPGLVALVILPFAISNELKKQ